MPLDFSSLEAQITANNTIIAGFQAALVADSANPLKTYTKDGEGLSRNEWRNGLVNDIIQLTQENIALQKIENQVAPYVIRTRHMPSP